MGNRKLKLFYIILAIFLFSTVLGCAEQKITATQQPNVTLSSPSDGGNISVNEPIIGNSTGVYNSGLHLYVLINPIASGNMWWVQPEAVVSPDGSWYANVQLGRSAQEDIGAKFWVTAIVISDTLSVGQINYPSEAKFSTKPIQLMRKYSDTNNLDPTTDNSDYTQVIVAIIGTIGLIVVAFISLIGRAKS